MNRRFFLLLFSLPLLGASCFLPQRKHTFIPPTGLHDTCEESENYFHSTLYSFCLPFPNDNWERISVSLPIDILGTTITTFNIFAIDEQFSVFTLYVAEASAENQHIFERELIPVIHASPYLVGYTLNPDRRLPPDLLILQEDVEEIVQNMVFD